MDGPNLEALQEPLDLPPQLRSPRAAEQHSESLPAPSERHLQGEGSQEQQRAQERAAQVWGNNRTVDLLYFCSTPSSAKHCQVAQAQICTFLSRHRSAVGSYALGALHSWPHLHWHLSGWQQARLNLPS